MTLFNMICQGKDLNSKSSIMPCMRWAVLLGVLALLFTYATTACAQQEIPTTWGYRFTTKDVPVYDLYSGIDGTTPAAGNNQYFAWGKAVFHKPQKSKHGTYKTEIVLIEYTCKKDAYSFRTLRDIKYSVDGHVISDMNIKRKRIRLDPNHARDLGLLPIDEAFAYSSFSMNNDCN